MNRIFLGSLLIGVVATVSIPGAADPPNLKDIEKRYGGPVVWVAKPKTAPVIDGQLDDPCWNDAAPLALGHCAGMWWDAPSQKTEARILADDKAVYFAVRCFEAEPERILADGTLRKGSIEKADAVEVFLDPGLHRKRFEYFHYIVTAGGTVSRGRGLEPETAKGSIAAKVGKFDKGWTVEAAIPLEDLGLKAGAVPKVWGINICRQRPELGYDMPKAARAAGNKRFDPPMWKLDEPKSYRMPEYTSWSPTMAEFCGWPFYNDSRPFHFAERFGRAVLEAGTQEVAAPAKLFEVLFKSDFDDGQLGPFKNAAIADDNFRGPGKSLTLAPGKDRIELNLPLEDLDDVTLIMTLRLKDQKLPVQHLSLTGKAPDGIWCGAERYEFFIQPEEAEARTKFLDEYHKEKYGAGPFELYDTHADMVRWKPCGAVRKGPGPWAMVEGYFAEPSGGQVRWPGKDWVIVRIRLGQFRRTPQPKQGQRLVPREQGYPNGLVLGAHPKDGLRIDDVVIFRGHDSEPPAKVSGLKAARDGDAVNLSWDKARDNTLTAFYRIYAGKTLVSQTHQLSARLPTTAVKDGPLTIVAVDLYGNASEPSESVK